MLLYYCPPPHSPRSSFHIGQVKATGRLRVSSTAPYFVDDRLYCPEEDMRESKPLHLCVSLVPQEAPPSTRPQGRTGLSATSGVSGIPPRARLERVKADTSDGGESRLGTPNDNECCGVAEDGGGVVQGPASKRARAQAAQRPDAPTGDDVQSTPWVLDICLVRIAGVCSGLHSFFRVRSRTYMRFSGL